MQPIGEIRHGPARSAPLVAYPREDEFAGQVVAPYLLRRPRLGCQDHRQGVVDTVACTEGTGYLDVVPRPALRREAAGVDTRSEVRGYLHVAQLARRGHSVGADVGRAESGPHVVRFLPELAGCLVGLGKELAHGRSPVVPAVVPQARSPHGRRPSRRGSRPESRTGAEKPYSSAVRERPWARAVRSARPHEQHHQQPHHRRRRQQ
jgi:hypothetical protein